MALFFVLVTGVGTMLAFGAATFGRKAWGRYRLVEDTETSPIGRLGAQGFAEVKGRIRARGALLTSPLAGTPCVYHRLVIEQQKTVRQYRSNGSTRRRKWVKVVDDTRSGDFVIRDGSGEAEVAIREARILLDRDSKARQGVFTGGANDFEDLMARYGQSHKGLLLNKTLRATETVLEEGDELYVLGPYTRRRELPRFAHGDPLFLVSDRGETRVARRYRLKAIAWAVAAVVVVVGFALLQWAVYRHGR